MIFRAGDKGPGSCVVEIQSGVERDFPSSPGAAEMSPLVYWPQNRKNLRYLHRRKPPIPEYRLLESLVFPDGVRRCLTYTEGGWRPLPSQDEHILDHGDRR